MTSQEPPRSFDGKPHATLIPEGTLLWRVHWNARKVTDFNDTVPEPGKDGRFDATDDDPYPYWYGAYEQSTALTETLLGDLEFDERYWRVLPYDVICGRRIAAVTTTCELRMLSLVSMPDLAAAGVIGDWVVQVESKEFPKTRKWPSWWRTLDPSAAGLVWQSRKDRPHMSLMLFGDRCAPGVLAPSPLPTVEFDGEDGTTWLNAMLRPYRASVLPSS